MCLYFYYTYSINMCSFKFYEYYSEYIILHILYLHHDFEIYLYCIALLHSLKLLSSTLYEWASLVAQTVKNPTAMRETWVQSLGWEDLLEEGMAL